MYPQELWRLFAVIFAHHIGRPFRPKEARMYISGEDLLVILLTGLIAGWLAGKIVAGAGFGLIGDIAV
jgi:hypothetical protein